MLRSTVPEPGSGVLPIDAFYEILTFVPAKQLCRLRAVCRTWRSLLCSPQFIAAHAARRRRPLILAGHDKSHHDEGVLCDIMDLSGRVIKRIRSTENEWVVSAQLDLACVANARSKTCKLLNLSTGDFFHLPEGLSTEHAPRKEDFLNYRSLFALGQAASTGEYKVFRVIDNGFFSDPYEQLCEVFTLGGSSDARWRGKKASAYAVDMCPLSRVAMDGIVCFLLDDDVDHDVQPKYIASFDLSTEEWRVVLQGPASVLVKAGVAHDACFSLAALNGSLVLVHQILNASMDLWFLMDFKKGLWVKKHSIQVHLNFRHDEVFAHPLVILDDGRIVTYIGSKGLLRIYNPRKRTYTNVTEMGARIGIGLYTGNLLSLPNGAI